MKKWKCTVCNQVFEGDAPPVPCPVCGAGEEAFVLEETSGPSVWLCTVCNQVFEGDAPPVPCPVCGADKDSFVLQAAKQISFEKNTSDKFVLVGGGVASLEAARAIRKRNRTAGITILCAEPHLPYNRPALSNVLADGLSFHNLLLEEENFYEENNITLRTGVCAKSIDISNKQVMLTDNAPPVPYTKLLIATGANAFNPVKPMGANAVPVHVLRRYEDAMELAKNAKGRRIVLVGGGILGLEAALALREIGCQITVVELASRLMPIQADEAASSLMREKLENLGIDVRLNLSVQFANETGVQLSNGTQLEADMVLASLGVRSEVELAVNIGLELSRGIVVDEFMHTSHKNIWAAGDCAEFNGRVVAMVGAAFAMGQTAGASMAGDENSAYSPFMPATAFSFSGFSIFSAGNVDADNASETVLRQNKRSGGYQRLFFKHGFLCGAVFIGDNPSGKVIAALNEKTPFAKALALLI